MQPESLVKLVGSGNNSQVEATWMQLVESASGAGSSRLTEYHVVLSELCRVGKQSQAEELAWTAIETITDARTPREGLEIAGPFLLAIGDSPTLRQQVTALYRSTYADQPGLDALLAESGIAGGRPVRRALRALQLGLTTRTGDYLVSRHEDAAARIDAIDHDTWQYDILVHGRHEALGVVPLADQYQSANAEDFRVMRHFAREELLRRMSDDPAGFVVELCRQHDNRLGSDRVEHLLVPQLVSEADWKSWWSRVKNGLKRFPQVTLEGRLPQVVVLSEIRQAGDSALHDAFRKSHSPCEKLGIVERYLRDCKSRKETPSTQALSLCHAELIEHGARLRKGGASAAILWFLAARRVGEVAGVSNPGEPARLLFHQASDPGALFMLASQEGLAELACDALAESRPEDWPDCLLKLLPGLNHESCEVVADRLLKEGKGQTDFEPIVQQILGSPVVCFEALLWLWDWPANAPMITGTPPIMILTRLLRTAEESRRDDRVAKETSRRIAAGAKSVVSARKYERFVRCLEGLDTGMASALKTQIGRMESLGRAVRADLLGLLRARFPALDVQRQPIPPWKREDCLYVTERGLIKKQEEVDQHVNVKMRENARAIGAAAEHGDLSENSEYKFALEERDLLRARLAQMNAEVAMARVISAKDVPTDHVGIGTCAILRRQTDGDRYEITFVGPWEADAARGWFNYRAPFAAQILGKHVGDLVEFNHSQATGLYEIVELRNALADEPVTSEEELVSDPLSAET